MLQQAVETLGHATVMDSEPPKLSDIEHGEKWV
jgi:hypothetical protein